VKNKIPEIRFGGFTQYWEQRKFGDYIIPFNEVTTQNNQYPIFTSSRKGLFFQVDYYDGNQIASEDNTGYNIVPRGYFTYRHMSDDLVFKFNINNLADNGIVSTLYPVFTTTENLDSRYLQYQLNEGEEFKRFAILQKQGGSRTYMYLSKLKSMMLTMPKLDEQIKIGNFLKQLDETITLHQQELATLKKTKQGFLQKMFPKEGESVPEVRFPGFTEDWEQRRLSDVADLMDGDRGKNYPSGDDFSNQGHTLFLNAANVTKNGFSFESDQYITEEKSNALGNGKLELNDIVLTSRGSIGHVAWYNNDIKSLVPFARINSGMLILGSKEDVEPSYIAQYLKSPLGKRQIDLISFGSAQPQLTKKDVSNYKISIPEKTEQAKLGEFFSNLDHLITLHQRELEALKETKKAFTQKMFV